MEKSNIERDLLRKIKEMRRYRAFRMLEKEWPNTKWSTICEALEKSDVYFIMYNGKIIHIDEFLKKVM